MYDEHMSAPPCVHQDHRDRCNLQGWCLKTRSKTAVMRVRHQYMQQPPNNTPAKHNTNRLLHQTAHRHLPFDTHMFFVAQSNRPRLATSHDQLALSLHHPACIRPRHKIVMIQKPIIGDSSCDACPVYIHSLTNSACSSLSHMPPMSTRLLDMQNMSTRLLDQLTPHPHTCLVCMLQTLWLISGWSQSPSRITTFLNHISSMTHASPNTYRSRPLISHRHHSHHNFWSSLPT